MTVLFTILKILGWVLLILLALVLVVLLIILFSPVRYTAVGSMQRKQVQGRVRATWLLWLVSFHMIFEEDSFHMYLRLFGMKKPLSGQDDKKTKKHKKHKKKAAAKEFPPEQKEKQKPEEQIPEDEKIPQKEPPAQETPEASRKKEASAPDVSHKKKRDTIGNKIKRKWNSMKRSIRRIRANIRKWSDICADEQNKEALSHIWRELYRLLKYIMPTKLSLHATYSAGSPDVTAQAFGVLAMFPVGYTNRWKIYPDFEAEEAYAEGNMDVRGHFLFIQILVPLLRVLFDKKCRRLYYKINK
jgi:hypothetical protein